MKLPKAEQNLGEWQAAIECLILVAEKNGPTMMGAHRHDEGAMPGSRQGAARSPPPRRAAPSSPAATARCPTHRWTHDRCRRRSPSGRMVRAYAAIGRRRHGPLCCRRANGALRFVLTIDYGPSLPPSEIITRGLIDPILTRWGASERLPRAENRCAVRLQF
jgi:hypothetical protein